MGEAVGIAWAEDEACAELERIFAEFVLTMTGGIRTFARHGIIAAQEVKEVSPLQFGGAVGSAVGINQKRKCDAGLFAEQARVAEVAHADRREIRSARLDLGFILAQLRDVPAAEYSAVVAQENDDGRLRLPQ
jgi:hypothetical protein